MWIDRIEFRSCNRHNSFPGWLLLPVHAVLHGLVRGGARNDPPRQQPDRQVGPGEGDRQRGTLCRLRGARGLPPPHKVDIRVETLKIRTF